MSDRDERGPDVCPDCGAAKGSLNGPNPHPACYAGVYSAITAEGQAANYGCLLRMWHLMRAHAEQAELAREALRAELAEANDRAAHATRRLVALRQAIPTLDHETTMDAVARLLREIDALHEEVGWLRGWGNDALAFMATAVPDATGFEGLCDEWDAWHQGQPVLETPQGRADMLRSEGDG